LVSKVPPFNQWLLIKSRKQNRNFGSCFYRPLAFFPDEAGTIEKATSIQLKYALLLDTDVEQVDNQPLFSLIDEWFGTPYRYGGSTKSGIDCSAFTQTLYCPGVRDKLTTHRPGQYKIAQPISRPS
jgi:lipoprotein Spr